MKAKIKIKKVAEGCYDFHNGKTLIGTIRVGAITQKYFFSCPGFQDADLSLLVLKANAERYIERKMKEWGVEPIFEGDF